MQDAESTSTGFFSDVSIDVRGMIFLRYVQLLPLFLITNVQRGLCAYLLFKP